MYRSIVRVNSSISDGDVGAMLVLVFVVFVVLVFDGDVVFVVFAFGAVFVAVVEEGGGGDDDDGVFGVLFDAFEAFVGVAAFIVLVGFGAVKMLMSSSSESFSCFCSFSCCCLCGFCSRTCFRGWDDVFFFFTAS